MLAFLKKLLLPSFAVRPFRAKNRCIRCHGLTYQQFVLGAPYRWSLAVPLLSNCVSAHIGVKGICSADVIDDVDAAAFRAALLR